MNLGKSITDFSVEGDEEANKDKMEDDDDHEQLDEEMGEPRVTAESGVDKSARCVLTRVPLQWPYRNIACF